MIKITQEEKDIIKNNKKLIQQEKFDEFFDVVRDEMVSCGDYNTVFIGYIFQLFYEVLPAFLKYLTKIPEYAFYDFQGSELTIPNNIKEIGNRAFAFADIKELKLQPRDCDIDIDSCAFFGANIDKLIIPAASHLKTHTLCFKCARINITVNDF